MNIKVAAFTVSEKSNYTYISQPAPGAVERIDVEWIRLQMVRSVRERTCTRETTDTQLPGATAILKPV